MEVSSEPTFWEVAWAIIWALWHLCASFIVIIWFIKDVLIPWQHKRWTNKINAIQKLHGIRTPKE